MFVKTLQSVPLNIRMYPHESRLQEYKSKRKSCSMLAHGHSPHGVGANTKPDKRRTWSALEERAQTDQESPFFLLVGRQNLEYLASYTSHVLGGIGA